MSTRRRFLAVSASAFTAAALPARMLASPSVNDVFSSATMGAYQQGILTQAGFHRLIGTLFMAFLDDGKVSYMRLVSSTSTTAASPAAPAPTAKATIGVRSPVVAPVQVNSFQVVFRTDGAVFSQGSYVLDHGTLGRFVCFLVPSAQANTGAGTCTATFAYLPANSQPQPVSPFAAPITAPISRPVNNALPVQPVGLPSQPRGKMFAD